MLLFNKIAQEDSKEAENFNTSNVTIQLQTTPLIQRSQRHFNTSNVTIQLLAFVSPIDTALFQYI